ncbi:MAG: glycosyltransferase family 2 protein [Bacteroidia bacterium]|nr:glycosyltransferase family 2 protein [Bacteroidia bacterium]
MLSVERAIQGMEAEVIVVDNNSRDGSQQMIREKFGDRVIFIENKDNPGFSKANNQGIAIAKGKWVLLLNPDTVVAEDTFHKCLKFSNSTADCGALGIYMLDGDGHFLPESKRALPTPWVSFYKIFGLAALFPMSSRFGKYHLSYLDKDQDHEIEILSGAFMWMRKSLLEDIGYLDETFFMYGEDIDLSYRVILGGMKNYYLADPKIIHYKGESTKKGSLNYVRVFYQAMIIFAKKHFGGAKKSLFIAAINLAVYFRAILAVGYRLIQRFGFAFLEALMIYGTMFGIKAYWEHYIKYIDGGRYPVEFPLYYMPAYTLVFVLLLWFMGAYKKPFRIRPLIVAPFVGFLTIATGTYMFTFIKNFSRAIVGLSAIFTTLLTIGTRGLLNRREKGNFFFTEQNRKKVLIVGDDDGLKKTHKLIRTGLDYPVEVIGGVSVDKRSGEKGFVGEIGELGNLIKVFGVDEVIFENASVATQTIFDEMIKQKDTGVSFKIVPPGLGFIIGPQETLVEGGQFSGKWAIQTEAAKKSKRALEFLASAVGLLTFPFSFWAYKQAGKAIRAYFSVLIGQRNLIGYIHGKDSELPQLKEAYLNLSHRANDKMEHSKPDSLDRFYAKNYSWQMDLEILLRSWRRIS